jgi:phosphonate transport system ATP-binding protein
MLEIRNLTKIYEDGTRALHNVSFTVEDGEFLIVIGLSGSGKSTLLRCINRLINPTSGEIIWNGINLCELEGDDLRKARRKIGMIFQHFNLVKRSSVMKNVMSGRLGYTNTSSALFNKFSKADMEMGRAVIKRLGITDQAHKRADELSGGQQQRVGIARALMQEPELILADEPVASLDPVLAHSILHSLETLNQEDGISIICSLHYLDLVQKYATRVVGLREGEIVYHGDKKDILALTDEEFKEIYGADAERVGGSVSGKTILG